MSKGIDIADLRDRINQLVEKASLSAYELGVYCADVHPKIKTKADEEEFFPGLTLDETMFSRYVKIGQNKFIRKYLASLPLAFSTLYYVSCLTEEEFKVGLAEGVINPSATRVVVQSWISLRKGKASVANDNQIIFRVVRPNDFTTEEEEKLNTELQEVLQRNRCRFSGNQAQALAATLKARGDYLRNNTRAKIIAD